MSKDTFLSNCLSFPKTAYDQLAKQKECRRICANLMANSDATPLDAAIKRRIRKYAKDVLGNPYYASWLYVYTSYRGSFLEGWVPEDFFVKVLPRINGVYNRICGAKTLTRRILPTNHLPDKAYHINGSWFDVQGNRLRPNEVKDVIFDQNRTAFVKLESMGSGKGIVVIHQDTFDEAKFSHKDKNFVVQRAIVQAGWFEAISPGCVATLRILTGLPVGGPPGSCAAYLRVGIKGAKFVTSNGALRIPVVDNEGTLCNFALDSNWLRYYSHPDSGVKFKEKKVPYFVEAVNLCEKLHERVPQFTVIGWDIAITESGSIEIIEWNIGYPDIKFAEATVGPCLKHLHLERFA